MRSSVVVMKNQELESVVNGRKRVIAMSILKGAKTPEQIMAVATSIGDGAYGVDDVVLKVLADYWAADNDLFMNDH